VDQDLGRRIADLRAKLGLTQQQLAERLGISRVAVSHLEGGISVASERTVTLLAGLFKIEPTELVAETSYPRAKAERLPLVACRYTEVELQRRLLEVDLAWIEALEPDDARSLVETWRKRLSELLVLTHDLEERRALVEALDGLAARRRA
jgi:transcriptional regulator with XRE-family HTH domain